MAAGVVEFDMAEVTGELRKLIRKASNLEDATRQISHIMLGLVDDKFEDEGPGWAPLSMATIKRRGPGKILQDSSTLVQSISQDSGADFAEVFTNVNYARRHVEGTKFIPVRDFFDIDMKKMQDLAIEILAQEVTS